MILHRERERDTHCFRPHTSIHTHTMHSLVNYPIILDTMGLMAALASYKTQSAWKCVSPIADVPLGNTYFLVQYCWSFQKIVWFMHLFTEEHAFLDAWKWEEKRDWKQASSAAKNSIWGAVPCKQATWCWQASFSAFCEQIRASSKRILTQWHYVQTWQVQLLDALVNVPEMSLSPWTRQCWLILSDFSLAKTERLLWKCVNFDKICDSSLRCWPTQMEIPTENKLSPTHDHWKQFYPGFPQWESTREACK